MWLQNVVMALKWNRAFHVSIFCRISFATLDLCTKRADQKRSFAKILYKIVNVYKIHGFDSPKFTHTPCGLNIYPLYYGL